MTWRPVCPLERLAPDRGVAALVDGAEVALFRLDGSAAIHTLGNIDPYSGVGCLRAGIVGDVGGEPMVVSPLHKQRFSLRTGRCLDDPSVGVEVYEVRVMGDQLEVFVR